MILKKFIKEYLNQKRDDHRWVKQLKAQEVDALIADMRPRPKLYRHFKLHQKVAFYLGVAYGSFSFWLDMGSGKTLVALELMKYWRQCGELRRMMVFVLSDKAFPTWEAQVTKYKIGVPIVTLEGSSEQKWHQLNKFKNGIVLITYAGAVAMCSSAVKGKRGKSKWRLVREAVNALSHKVDMFVMDESTRAGHDSSLTHKLCTMIANRVEHRYGLAGRPFGRDPILLWAQQKIIDQGLSLGPNKGMFQAVFYSKERNRFAKSPFAFEYTFKKSMMPQLSNMMQHRSITYEEKEYQDVAKVNRIVVPVNFSISQQEYYLESVADLAKQSKKGFVEMKNAFLRLRQITSGFIGYKNDETGDKVQLAFESNPKLDRLLDMIDELPLDRKCLVFYEYTWSARQIVDKLRNLLDIEHIWLWSGTKDARASLKKFMTKDKCRVALINNRVGAYSLDGLQHVANYTFFYESPVPVIDREQAEKRTNRQGQKRRCYYYDLTVPGSVDTRILEFHKEGRDLIAESRKNPRLLLTA